MPAPTLLVFGQARFVSIDVNIVWIDTNAQLGAGSASSRQESRLQPDGQQQERGLRRDRAVRAIGSEQARCRRVPRGAKLVELGGQRGHLIARADDGGLNTRELGQD